MDVISDVRQGKAARVNLLPLFQKALPKSKLFAGSILLALRTRRYGLQSTT